MKSEVQVYEGDGVDPLAKIEEELARIKELEREQAQQELDRAMAAAPPRKLKVKWSVDANQDLKTAHHIDLSEAILDELIKDTSNP